MSKVFRIAIFIAFGLFITGFFIKSISFIDPDFGWHYRTGEFIVAHGIPRTDLYSYTMSDFPYIEHEWLTDVGMYILYQTIGWYGLALVYTIFTLSTLLILFQQTRSWISLISILFTGEIFILQGGIRDQVIPWLFVALIIWICSTRQLWEHVRYIIPIIIMLWVNIHGSFPFGIGITAIYVVVHCIKTRRIDWQDIAVLILCGIATLINPYMWQIWEEIWREQFNTSWHWSIQEWQPAFFTASYSFCFFFPISLVFSWLYKKKFSLFSLVLYGVSLLMALSITRHIPLWAIIAFLLTTEGLGYLQKQVLTYSGREKSFHEIYLVLLTITIIGVGFDAWNIPPNLHFTYPKEAIMYLQTHPVKKHLFAEFDWGGYTIWNLPGVKTFVDGRMPSWQFSTENPYESTNAYKEYQDIYLGKESMQFAIRKYDIDTILWSNSNNKSNLHNNFIQEIKKAGFKEIYHDNIAVIYQMQ